MKLQLQSRLDPEGLVLPPFRGGHLQTGRNNSTPGHFQLLNLPQIKTIKNPRYPQIWMSGLPGDPHYNLAKDRAP